MRIAVVDLGTNTTRVLVADVEDGALTEIERRTTITRLGEGVDATGRLAEPAMERVMAALTEYRQVIDDHGAERVVALATSAVRDATNGSDLQRRIADRLRIDIEVIDGHEEGRLTFLGATREQTVDVNTLVIDIGGGSTELVVGRPRAAPEFQVSTQAGSVRQTERHLSDDPPQDHQLADLALEVQLLIEDQVPGAIREGVQSGIAVAGTATSLAAIEQELDPYDPARVHGYTLGLGACEEILARLAALPLEDRREVPGLHPDRAPTIVAGAAILVEAMRAFGLDEVVASEADILHGAAVNAAEAAL